MYITVDLSQVPPLTTLHDPDDFKDFKIVVTASEHTWVGPDVLLALDGAKPDDADWRAQLEGMLSYAGSKGWLDDRGYIRAHIERET